jgi:glucose/arabinose dehydrogenase
MRINVSVSTRITRVVVVALGLAAAACTDEPSAPSAAPTPGGVNPERAAGAVASAVTCDAGNGGITLPAGFCAVVVADHVGAARHVTTAANGDVYVAINDDAKAGGVLALRDMNGDGKADVQTYFGEKGANGIAWTAEYLYVAYPTHIVRWRMPTDGSLVPNGTPQMIVTALPDSGDHFQKNIQLDGHGSMYVNIGSASNSCQVQNRVLHSPGIDPCPELPTRAGIWKFSAFVQNQTQKSGEHFAMGFRNTEALRWDAVRSTLYGIQHGRDMLHTNWPELFTEQQQADLPSEEYAKIDRGDDNGWPYCYHDWQKGRKMLAPEYGGDGNISGPRCDTKEKPMLTFPGHWAPNDLLFYTGAQFPAKYHDGAFVAFHGGHDRAPLPEEGFDVVFVPRVNGVPQANWEVFANGFTGGGEPLPQNAAHRPMGLAQGPDGSLYVTDDQGGRIWRIVYGH